MDKLEFEPLSFVESQVRALYDQLCGSDGWFIQIPGPGLSPEDVDPLTVVFWQIWPTFIKSLLTRYTILLLFFCQT